MGALRQRPPAYHVSSVVHPVGVPVVVALTGAKADERETQLGMLDADPTLVVTHPGQTLIGDKNYYGRVFEAELAEAAASSCSAPPARARNPVRDNASSSRCARSSNRSTKPSTPNSTSNATAGTP